MSKGRWLALLGWVVFLGLLGLGGCWSGHPVAPDCSQATRTMGTVGQEIPVTLVAGCTTYVVVTFP